MAISLAQAKSLQWTDTLIDNFGRKWRVNGKVKLWKRNPNKVRVPVKYGLYTYDYVTEENLHQLSIVR